MSEHIIKYVASLVRATRPKDDSAPKFVQELVDWGAGPRAGQFLIHGGKALAAMDGRFSVAIDDVQKVAVPVLRHRISTNFQAQAEGMTTEDVIARLLQEIPVPEIPKFAGDRNRHGDMGDDGDQHGDAFAVAISSLISSLTRCLIVILRDSCIR